MLRWLKRKYCSNVTLSGEEARTAIHALQRSARSLGDPNEGFRAAEMRSTRETRLAKAIGVRLPRE